MTGRVGCCARATSGHAAAPPSAAMNSRRFVGPTGMRCILRVTNDHSMGRRPRQTWKQKTNCKWSFAENDKLLLVQTESAPQKIQPCEFIRVTTRMAFQDGAAV